MCNKQVDLTLHDQSCFELLGCVSIMPKTTKYLPQIVYLSIGIQLGFLEDLSPHVANILVTWELIVIAFLRGWKFMFMFKIV